MKLPGEGDWNNVFLTAMVIFPLLRPHDRPPNAHLQRVNIVLARPDMVSVCVAVQLPWQELHPHISCSPRVFMQLTGIGLGQFSLCQDSSETLNQSIGCLSTTSPAKQSLIAAIAVVLRGHS